MRKKPVSKKTVYVIAHYEPYEGYTIYTVCSTQRKANEAAVTYRAEVYPVVLNTIFPF